MNLLSELIDGTIPSHHLMLSLDVALFGLVLTLHQLEFKGTHAGRALFQQVHTNARALILKRGGKLMCVVPEQHWQSSVEFEVVAYHVVSIGDRR